MKLVRNKKRVLVVNGDFRRASEPINERDRFEDFRVVGIYHDLKHAFLSLPKSRPEILVVAITRNDLHLLHLLKKFRAHLPGLQILIQTDIDDEIAILEIVTVGIVGIVSLNSRWDELFDSLRAIESGNCPLNNVAAKVLLSMLQLNVDSELTPRQLEILKLMSMGKTHVTIADQLRISPETAKTHVKNIYKRLNVSSKEEALSVAVEERLILFF